jgi:hypothetical protein
MNLTQTILKNEYIHWRRYFCFRCMLLCFVGFSAAPAVAATAPALLWSVPSGVADSPLGIGIDSQGHVRTVGYSAAGNTGGAISLFFHTYDTNGQILESFVASNNVAGFLSAAIDAVGNAYVAGDLGHSGRFGAFQLTNPGPSTVVFVAKYSPSGKALWATCSTGGFGADLYGIAIDPAGNAYITGDFLGTGANPAKFGPSSLVNTTTAMPDGFVAKFDTNGKLLWGSRFGDGATARGMSVAADKTGNSYVTGTYNGPWGSQQLVSKFNPTGALLWSHLSKPAHPNQYSFATGIAIAADQNGNFCVAGTLGGSNLFGSVELSTPVPAGARDVGISKCDATGNVVWACQAGDTNEDGALRVAMDSKGDVLVHGYYNKVTIIGSTRLTNSSSSSTGYYIAKTSPTGGFAWVVPLSGDIGATIRMAPAVDGSIYLTSPNGGLYPSWLHKIGMIDSPVIILEPTNETIMANTTATLMVESSPTQGVAYQWYRGTAGDISNPISGAVSNQFTTPALSATTAYWVRASNAAGTADSSTALVNVITFDPARILVAPNNAMILRGESITFSVTATGTEPLAFQWYQIVNGSPVPISGANSTNYTTGPLTNSAAFSITVSNFAGVDSRSAGVTVVAPVIITQQPQGKAIANGESVILSVTATGGQFILYQWFVGESGNTNSPIPGAILSTYTTGPLTATSEFWVLVTSVLSRVPSETAILNLRNSHCQLGQVSLSSGKLTLSMTGPPVSCWQVEASDDLSNWRVVTEAGAIALDASGSTNLQIAIDGARPTFYRATLMP